MICIIDCGSDFIGELEQRFIDSGVETKVIAMDDLLGTNLNNFRAFVISGSAILRDEANRESNITRLKTLFAFIKTTTKPVLGICFGHQMIGLLFGSEFSVKTLIDYKESIEIVGHSSLFSGIDSGTKFQEEHRNHISLPDDFELLARSASSENEAMKHKTKSIFAVQFHPEMSGDAGMKLIKNFISITEAAL